MPENDPKNPGPFDVRTIKDLVALMSRHDLNEIDLREGQQRIRLRRGPRGKVSVSSAAPAAATSAAPPPAANAESPSTPAKPAKPARELQPIKSPTPGTFYASPSPDADPFVRVGSRVEPSTVVCIIEAMKIFNEITADCSGVIAEIAVENQQAVEFGQALFHVDPNG